MSMSLPVHPRHVMDDRIDLGDEPEQFGSKTCKRPSLRMIGQYVLLAVSCWGKSPPRVTSLTHWVGMGWEGWEWGGSRGIQQILLIVDRCCLWDRSKTGVARSRRLLSWCPDIHGSQENA